MADQGHFQTFFYIHVYCIFIHMQTLTHTHTLDKNSQSTASSFVPSPPAAAVSGPTTSSANKDRVKDKGRDKGGGATPVSSNSKQNKNVSKSSSGAPITKHTGSSSSLSTGKPNYSNKSTPSSSKTKSSKVSPSPSSSSAKFNSKSSISHSGSNSAKPKGKPVVQASNFQDLLKTAKQNASGDKIASKLDKSACTGKLLDGAKLKEPTRSSSPVGRSLLERNHLRLKNKRSYDVMKQGMNPRGTLPGGASSGNYSAGMGLAKSSEFKSRLGSTLSPTKSNDLVRRPLRSPVTSCPPPSLPPSKHNGMRSSSQLERADKMPRQGGSFASGSTSSKARATTAPQQSTSSLSSTKGGSGGVRGSKTPFPPLSSLTPQQIQKLKAARAAAALSGGGMPPTKKKKALNPTAFYGSAAATILQRKGQPKLTASGPLKYTSSYVDEMMDYLRSEGVNGVEDLYSDEEVEEMDDFIASDDEFIDDSEDDGDYSSAIRKIFGYDRSRQVL